MVPNDRDMHHLTPFHRAAQEGRLKLMRVLFLHGADVGSRSKDGESAVHLAVRRHHLETVALLLELM